MALAQPDLEEQVRQVQGVANALNIPLTVIDLQAPFREKVLAYFRQTYATGRTPNPCVICNQQIKFGLLLDQVLKSSDWLATGHYARLVRATDGRARLLAGLDPQKDQSYFLNQLSQAQLTKLLFPLGTLHKTEVRALATELGLHKVHGAESQDVCFLQGQTVQQFLTGAGDPSPPGPVQTLDGTEIGQHLGIRHYTVGQRRGLGLPDATPYYVLRLDAASNTVVVGKEPALWRQEVTVGPVTWTAGTPPGLPHHFLVKIRYRHPAAQALVQTAPAGGCTLSFIEPQRAVAPGQFAAFYQDEEVVGGGEILAEPSVVPGPENLP
jgi:tRNA-specific 2-thiouridylase